MPIIQKKQEDNTVLIAVDISIPDIAVRNSAEDVGYTASEKKLPDDIIRGFGTKRFLGNEVLHPFHRHRDAVRRWLEEKGYPEAASWFGLDAELLDDFTAFAQETEKVWEKDIAELKRNYASLVEAFALAHPDQSEAILAFAPSEENFLKKFAFKVVIGGYDEEAKTKSITSVVAKKARALYAESLSGRTEVKSRVIKSARRIMEPYSIYARFDGRFGERVKEVNALFDSVPKNGPYQGAELERIKQAVLLLGQPLAVEQSAREEVKAIVEAEKESEDEIIVSTIGPEDFVDKEPKDTGVFELPFKPLEGSEDSDVPVWLKKAEPREAKTTSVEPLELALEGDEADKTAPESESAPDTRVPPPAAATDEDDDFASMIV